MSLGGAEPLAAPSFRSEGPRSGLWAQHPRSPHGRVSPTRLLGAECPGGRRCNAPSCTAQWGRGIPLTPQGASQGTHCPGRPLRGLHYDLGATGAGLGGSWMQGPQACLWQSKASETGSCTSGSGGGRQLQGAGSASRLTLADLQPNQRAVRGSWARPGWRDSGGARGGC